jgi:hypothetical protein
LGLDQREADIVGKVCHSHGEQDINQWHELAIIQTEKIRLRLLCCLVGLADVCDVTSDRAPELVYKILKPGTESDSFWRTHLAIGGLARNDDGAICIEGQYKSSKGNRLIQQVVASIQDELDLVYATVMANGLLIGQHIIAQIDPSDPRLSDISFQKFLNGQSILNVLTQSLYTNQNVFVRELLQNAIDACTLRMALCKDTEEYHPEIRIDISGTDGVEFTIEDNGIGMDLHDVENQFAVPGATWQHSLESWDGGAMEVDGLIARFGIGILSCFLCCDWVEVETMKRLSNPLRFRIDDLRAKYGFLRSAKCTQGTVVRVRLAVEYTTEFLVGAVRHYLRACRYETRVYVNGTRLDIGDLDTLVPAEAHRGIIKTDVMTGVISFDPQAQNQILLCQEGILVSHNLETILPKYAVGIKGYLNVQAGHLDLTASRTEIKENDRFDTLRQTVEKEIRSLIDRSVSDICQSGSAEDQDVLLHCLLEMSHLSGEVTGFLAALITRWFKFENLDGEIVPLDSLLAHDRAYYLPEHGQFSVTRCRWLGRAIRSNIDPMSALRKMNIPKSNILFLKSSLPFLSHLVMILKNYLAKSDTLLTDITEMDYFADYLDAEKLEPVTRHESTLKGLNISFAKIQNSLEPVVDLGTEAILNLSNTQISFVYQKLVNKTTNKTTAYAALAYCLMMAQRFDLAHSYVASLVDLNTPPMVEHGTYKWTEYDVTMHKAQKLFYAGLYEEAADLLAHHGLQGRWAERLKRACFKRMRSQTDRREDE